MVYRLLQTRVHICFIRSVNKQKKWHLTRKKFNNLHNLFIIGTLNSLIVFDEIILSTDYLRLRKAQQVF